MLSLDLLQVDQKLGIKEVHDWMVGTCFLLIVMDDFVFRSNLVFVLLVLFTISANVF